MEQPRSVVQHTHGALNETRADHLLEFANSGEFGAFTRLLKLDFACKQAPENLGDEFVVRIRLCSKNFLQHVEVMVGIYEPLIENYFLNAPFLVSLTFVLLAFEKKLCEVKQVLAVADGDFAGTLAELFEVELALSAHTGNLLSIAEELDQLLRLLFSGLVQFLGLSRVSRNEARLDLLLKAL